MPASQGLDPHQLDLAGRREDGIVEDDVFFPRADAAARGEEGAFAAVAAHAPFARWSLPEEVARGILYLACDDSAPLTGTNLIFENGDSA